MRGYRAWSGEWPAAAGPHQHSLEPGTEIFVEGWRARSGDYKANGSSITFKDSKKLFPGSSHDEPPDTRQKWQGPGALTARVSCDLRG